MSIVTRVAGALSEHRLASAGDRVVAALSGGPDSVALAWILREALPAVGADLAGLAHLNHRLRGDASDADEAFCAALAAELEVRLVVERADVRAAAREARRSVEAVAHDLRYAFFERARERLGATSVATGHTRNDQAETVLLRLVRGAGLTGLGGIRVRRGHVIRPLLDVSRDEIAAFLRERGLPFRVDASNLDTTIERNRIRHQVLPLLEEQCHPRVIDALARAAALVAADGACLDEIAAGSASEVVRTDDAGAQIDLAALASLPRALQRRLVWQTLCRLSGGGAIGASHVARVLRMATPGGDGGAAVDLPGMHVTRTRGVLALRARRVNTTAPSPAQSLHRSAMTAPRHLAIPGCVEDPDGGWRVSVRFGPAGREVRLAAAAQAIVDAGAVARELSVRTRRPGDRFRPLGLGGRKKLQDYFVDRKVPRGDRDRVPLVVDALDRIVWVAGHAIAEDFRVTPATTGVLLLQLSPVRRLV